MKTKAIGLLVLVLVVMAVIPVSAGGRPLSADLLGSNEVGPGDPDGSGTAHVTLNQGQGEVCYDISVSDIATPTRAHIHRGESGSNGPVVVGFFDFVSPPPLQGCVSGVDAGLIKEIRQNPGKFYVNIHNGEYPGGAVRGQLSK